MHGVNGRAWREVRDSRSLVEGVELAGIITLVQGSGVGTG